MKTSQGRKRPDGTRQAALDKVDLLQLIGYVLLDFDDDYQITEPPRPGPRSIGRVDGESAPGTSCLARS